MPDLADSVGLVLDTSVWINLLATEAANAIVAALPCACHAPQPVVAELVRDPITGVPFASNIHPLLQMAPHVSVVALDAAELELFLDLVGAPAVDALGDGEAATIAVAATRGLDLVIDDRKARRIVRERFGNAQVYWTVDLLRAAPVVAALGSSQAEICFEKARRYGRMHLPKS